MSDSTYRALEIGDLERSAAVAILTGTRGFLSIVDSEWILVVCHDRMLKAIESQSRSSDHEATDHRLAYSYRSGRMCAVCESVARAPNAAEYRLPVAEATDAWATRGPIDMIRVWDPDRYRKVRGAAACSNSAAATRKQRFVLCQIGYERVNVGLLSNTVLVTGQQSGWFRSRAQKCRIQVRVRIQVQVLVQVQVQAQVQVHIQVRVRVRALSATKELSATGWIETRIGGGALARWSTAYSDSLSTPDGSATVSTPDNNAAVSTITVAKRYQLRIEAQRSPHRTAAQRSLQRSVLQRSSHRTAAMRFSYRNAAMRSQHLTTAERSRRRAKARLPRIRTAARQSRRQIWARRSRRLTAARRSWRQTALRHTRRQTAARRSRQQTAARRSRRQKAAGGSRESHEMQRSMSESHLRF